MSSIYQRNRYWWIKYRDLDGVLRRESLGTPHSGIARKMQKIKIRQLRDGQKYQPAGFDSIVADYLSTIRSTCNPNHYINVKGRLDRYFTDCHISTPLDITTSSVQNWCNGLLRTDLRPRTVRGYMMSVSGFCSHLVDSDHLPDNPCRRVRLPRIHDMPPRFLTRLEVAGVLRLARKLGILPEIYLALKSGLRSAEIRKLLWADVLFEQDLIYVRKEQGKRPRSVPLTPRLKRFLLQMRRTGNGPVFRGEKGGFVGEKQWRQRFTPLSKLTCFKRCGKTLHALRYTYASWYVQNGGDIYRLSKILGHGSVVTTQKSYAHLSADF